MSGGRIHCCIPECRRSFRCRPGESADAETICGRCWRTADARLVGRHRALKRRYRRICSLLQRKKVQGKRGGFGFLWRQRRACELFEANWRKNWEAIKLDATIKSRMRVEGTAGWLAAKRAARAA